MKKGSCLPIVFSQVIYSGGYSDGEPPLPIPNREAKPVIADCTARPGGRVGSCRSSGESSDVRLRTLFFCIGALPQTLTLRAAFASSTYLLPQIPGPACLNPPIPLFKGAHQAFVRTRAHGHRFAVLRLAS